MGDIIQILQFLQITVMKHYLITLISRLYEAIKRGILRIFPLPLKPVLYALAILTLLTVYGCASTHPVTQTVERVSRDTIYINTLQQDSIYIFKDRLIDRSRDTVYLKDVSVEYRYKFLHDTLRVTQRDTIPVEVTVTELKEIQRPLTWFDHLTRLTFWFVFGYLISLLIFKIKRVF